MPDFITPSESEHPDTPLYAPAEDIPEGVPADALPAAEDAGETAPTAEGVVPPPAAPLTADRALNIAFGAALLLTDAVKLTAQKLGEQAEFVQNNAPAVLDALEEKGKPVRELVMQKLRDAVSFTPGDDEGDGSDLPPTSGEVDISQELPRPSLSEATASTAVPFAAPTLSGGSAEAEISALERRVRELEQEVSKPLVVSAPDAEPQPQPVEPSDTPLEATSDGDISGETTAEFSTYDFAPDAPAALADSPYAVSETLEETTAENAGEGDEAANGESHQA